MYIYICMYKRILEQSRSSKPLLRFFFFFFFLALEEEFGFDEVRGSIGIFEGG